MSESEYGPVKDGADEKTVFVSLGKKQSRPPTTEAPQDEVVNLASLFSAKEREDMGKRCWDLYVADVRSRADRMKKYKKFLELYASLTKRNGFPYQNVPHVNVPALAYPMLQVHARLYDMIWPENGKVIHSAPSSPSDMQRATATEKFGNSYIRIRMPEMEQGLDDTLAQMCLFGSAFRRTYWDAYERRVRSDWIPAEDFVVAREHRSQDPSMRDVPRYTLVNHMTMADLETYGQEGIYENVDGLRLADDDNAEGKQLEDTKAKLDGTSSSARDDQDPDKPRMVLEQHCRWRLPNRPGHPSFDGRYHYVIITIDEPTKRVLRVVLREEDDPEDVKRYNREAQETGFAAYKVEREAYEAGLAQAQAAVAAGDPNAILPMPPPEVTEPAKPRKRQVCFFTHYRAFPSEGFYGLGFGDFIAPLAESANNILNQFMIGMTLKNSRPGFISTSLRGPQGAVQAQPGVLQPLDAPAAAIKEGIVWLDVPPNDPGTIPAAKMLLDMGEKLAGSSDIMSGSTSGANRTAKEMQILNSQVMKQISVLARRVIGAFKHEIDKIWRCWGVFLPEKPETMPVVDPATGQPEELPISRAMFIPDARVIPAADPRMRFEKIEEAQQKFGAVMSNPMTAQNPMAVYEATKEQLQAIGADRILAYVQPPQPPPPPQAKPHHEEAAGWLRGEQPNVHPDDNDDEHTNEHLAFLSSPDAQMLAKEGRDAAEQHVRNHRAQALQKRAAAMQANQQQGPMMPGPQMGGMPIGPA